MIDDQLSSDDRIVVRWLMIDGDGDIQYKWRRNNNDNINKYIYWINFKNWKRVNKGRGKNWKEQKVEMIEKIDKRQQQKSWQ